MRRKGGPPQVTVGASQLLTPLIKSGHSNGSSGNAVEDRCLTDTSL